MLGMLSLLIIGITFSADSKTVDGVKTYDD